MLPWSFGRDLSGFDETVDDIETYDGPNAAHYYELCATCKECKRELLIRREHLQKRKDDARMTEQAKEKEVEQKTYEALENFILKGGTPNLGRLDSQFDIFCVDYFYRFYDPNPHGYMTRHIKFQDFDCQKGNEDEAHLEGRFWLNANVTCDLIPFKPPRQTSLKHFKTKTIDAKHTLVVQFLDDNHLTLRTSRDLVWMDKPQEETIPETFVFEGVRNDFGKHLQTWSKLFAQTRGILPQASG
ncbi:hypothetical protein F66182_7686 [Fusarium sp. NRRL 66182]|nr:hypothetical protein F66182_7686 [Fusarium sp. NRRL 66182]